MAKDLGRTALYRLFSETGDLLYVGISRKPDVRWGQHSEDKEWWSAVDRRAVEWHETRASAEHAESAAIKAEGPLHNVLHVPKPPRPRKPQNTERHTPLRPLRIPDDEWEALGQAVGDRNRTRLLREYIRWHLRWPGNAQPTRETQQVGGPGLSSKATEQPNAEESAS